MEEQYWNWPKRHGKTAMQEDPNWRPKSEARALMRAQRMSEGTPEKPGRRNHMVALARSVTMQNEIDKAARKHGGPAREPMGYHRRLAIYKAQRGVGPITERQARQIWKMTPELRNGIMRGPVRR